MRAKIIKVDFSKRGRDLRGMEKELKEDQFWEKIEMRIKMNVN